MNARHLRVTGACVLAATLLVSACDESNPPSPLPATADPARPITLTPSTYLLRADQMTGYARSASKTLTSGILGDEAADPSLAPALDAQGLQYGARFTYTSPPNSPTVPFTQVISEAVLFNDAAGAQRFVADERRRRNVPPSNGGTVGPVQDLAATNADEVFGLTARAPADNPGTTVPPLTWLAVVRRGRVVVELVGSGLAEQATRARFDALLAQQETLLSVPPGG